jgi:hypothetical protein
MASNQSHDPPKLKSEWVDDLTQCTPSVHQLVEASHKGKYHLEGHTPYPVSPAPSSAFDENWTN